jgi:hypothetical protein
MLGAKGRTRTVVRCGAETTVGVLKGLEEETGVRDCKDVTRELVVTRDVLAGEYWIGAFVGLFRHKVAALNLVG